MSDTYFLKQLRHNNWANGQIIQACAALTDEQLDASPQSVTSGTIRQTLTHLVAAQERYVAHLTLPLEARPHAVLSFDQLAESSQRSGEALIALVEQADGDTVPPMLELPDGYSAEPWVILVQVIDHAAEHREQIKSMISALGITPPDTSGWDFGEAAKAFIRGEN